MKKLIAVALVLVLALSLVACSSETNNTQGNKDVKIGVILVHDENTGYDEAHINGIKKALENCGIPNDTDHVVWKYNVPENEKCHDAAIELVEAGCTYIFSDSYGHQDHMRQAATENPDVVFASMTGDTAALSGLKNFKNAFCNTYESRYVSGVVAGMKLQQLIDEGKLTDANYDADGNIKIGYVGAFNYSEVVSGYTAFYLGIRSIVENVAMEVTYTSSWFNVDAEAAAAEQLAADGCVIVGQHADSTGAPSACEQLQQNGTVVYSVGYNVDMLDVAPNAALTSATNNWERFYEYAFSTIINGEKLETNWAKGYNDDAVGITALGASCAPGTAEKVAEVEEAIRNGTLHVFDTSTFTVSQDQGFCTVTTDADGHVTSCLEDMSFYDYTNGPTLVYEGETVEAITDGYFAESTFRSAPYFNIRIDGITELN